MKHTLLAIALLATAVAAAAGSTGAPKGAAAAFTRSGASLDTVTSTKEKLSESFNVTGNGSGASLPQFSYTTVGETTVKCNHAHGCSIGLEAMGQVQTGGGDWAICLLIDGSSTSCQYQGVQSGPSGYVVGNARGWESGLSQGNHTITMQLYSEGTGAVYAYYQLDINVYKP